MTITASFTTTDQKNAEGEVVDKIFTITEVETINFEKVKTLSGTEVSEQIKDLENQILNEDKKTTELQNQINFLKTLK